MSAEIPDKDKDPDLYKIITELNIHCPCGNSYVYNGCFNDKKECSKDFPKAY